MRRLLPLLVPLALAACSQGGAGTSSKSGAPATADAGGSAPQAGLWKTTTRVDGRKVLGENQTCTGTDSKDADLATGEEGVAGCSVARRETRPDGYDYELVCEQDGLRSIVSGEVRRSARSTTASSTTRIVGPDGKDAGPASHVVVESVYAGACPAGMKPGDSVQKAAE